MGGTNSGAVGINDAGQVVGASNTVEGYPHNHAFITSSDGMGMRDLGTLGGTGYYDQSHAFDINDVGQVAGYSYTAADIQHGLELHMIRLIKAFLRHILIKLAFLDMIVP